MKNITIWVKAKLQAIKVWLAVSKKRQRLTAIAGILVIALTGQIIYSSFAATTEYSQIPEVAKMQKLTEEVIKLTDEYAAMPDTINGKKAANQPNETKTTRGKELTAKVKGRRDAYLVAMQYDPQTTANYYLPYTTRDKLPSDAKFYTETAVDIQGYWITGTTETEKGGARTLIKLQLDDGNRLAVYGSNLPDFSPGARVRITGIQLERNLIAALPYRQKDTQAQSTTQSRQPFFSQIFISKVGAVDVSSLCKNLLGPITGKICPDEEEDDGSNDNAPTVSFCVPVGDSTLYASCTNDSHNPVTNEEGGRKVLVIAMALPGEDGGIFSDGETYNIGEIKGAYNNVKNMYSVMSYGKLTPDVTVYPEYTQIKPEDFFNYDDLEWRCSDNLYDDVESAAKGAINRTAGLKQQAEEATDIAILYNNIPCDGSDGGGRQGWAYVGVSNGSKSQKGTTNNVLSGRSLTSLTSTFAHEFGHSIGLRHTGAACAVDSDNCADNQGTYGDIYNMMGGSVSEEYTSDSFMGDSVSFNAVQKQRLGWLDDSSIYDVPFGWVEGASNYDTKKAEVRLNALWQNTGVRGINLMVGGKKFLLEYRPKTSQGVDNFNNNKLSEGILVYNLHAGSACSDSNCEVNSLLMNGKKGDKYNGDSDYYKDRYKWDYTKAATLEPFMLKNDTTGDSVCVLPSNISENSVDVEIRRNCSDDVFDQAPQFISSSVKQDTNNKWPDSMQLDYKDLPKGLVEGDRVLAVVTAYYTRHKDLPDPTFSLPGWDLAGNGKNPSLVSSTSTLTTRNASNVSVFSWQYKTGQQLPALTAEKPLLAAGGSADAGNYYRVTFLGYRPSLPVHQTAWDAYASGYLEGEGNTGIFEAEFPKWSNTSANATVLYGQFDTLPATVISGIGPNSNRNQRFGPITTRVDLPGVSSTYGPLRIADTQVHGVYSGVVLDAWDRSIITRGMCFTIVLDGTPGAPSEFRTLGN